jgi:radical SAM family uncharacterized protein
VILTPTEIERRLAPILPQVEKPGRYTGGELNSVVKDWASEVTRVCLAFPEIYDIGMSNLGLAILYDLLNQRADVLAERAYVPWVDMEAAMRREGVPLYSLETKHALADFDILGVSLPYEQLYSNVLNLLDLAGLPLLAAERTLAHPLVIAGGHAMFNPEPMADFLDAIVIGEGEEVMVELVQAYQAWKSSAECQDKPALLARLAQVKGVYVPALYMTTYQADGTVAAISPTHPAAPAKVLKRVVAKLPPPITRLIVPYIDTVHNRMAVEIMRGCTRGCRFCHAGMIMRPVRERSVDEIMQAIDAGLAHTGFEEVALLSLSSSDYSHILELVRRVGEKYGQQHLNVSLPSLRLETSSVELMDLLKDSKRGGFTFAPEAATERMRATINKPVTTAQVLEVARTVFARGWPTIKLYFMIGHPEETLDDVRAIVDLCQQVIAEGRKILGKKVNVHAGVSTFIPKPHTPFQWVASDTQAQVEAKQALLRRELRGPGLKLNWNNPLQTQLEAWLARGDRRLGRVILAAWKRGAKFDAWQEAFDHNRWVEAFRDCGLDPDFYLYRTRPLDEVFPWQHIDVGVRPGYLAEDYARSLRGETRGDCRDQCYACGILPVFNELRANTADDDWKCPPVRSPQLVQP